MGKPPPKNWRHAVRLHRLANVRYITRNVPLSASEDDIHKHTAMAKKVEKDAYRTSASSEEYYKQINDYVSAKAPTTETPPAEGTNLTSTTEPPEDVEGSLEETPSVDDYGKSSSKGKGDVEPENTGVGEAEKETGNETTVSVNTTTLTDAVLNENTTTEKEKSKPTPGTTGSPKITPAGKSAKATPASTSAKTTPTSASAKTTPASTSAKTAPATAKTTPANGAANKKPLVKFNLGPIKTQANTITKPTPATTATTQTTLQAGTGAKKPKIPTTATGKIPTGVSGESKTTLEKAGVESNTSTSAGSNAPKVTELISSMQGGEDAGKSTSIYTATPTTTTTSTPTISGNETPANVNPSSIIQEPISTTATAISGKGTPTQTSTETRNPTPKDSSASKTPLSDVQPVYEQGSSFDFRSSPAEFGRVPFSFGGFPSLPRITNADTTGQASGVGFKGFTLTTFAKGNGISGVTDNFTKTPATTTTTTATNLTTTTPTKTTREKRSKIEDPIDEKPDLAAMAKSLRESAISMFGFDAACLRTPPSPPEITKRKLRNPVFNPPPSSPDLRRNLSFSPAAVSLEDVSFGETGSGGGGEREESHKGEGVIGSGIVREQGEGKERSNEITLPRKQNEVSVGGEREEKEGEKIGVEDEKVSGQKEEGKEQSSGILSPSDKTVHREGVKTEEKEIDSRENEKEGHTAPDTEKTPTVTKAPPPVVPSPSEQEPNMNDSSQSQSSCAKMASEENEGAENCNKEGKDKTLEQEMGGDSGMEEVVKEIQCSERKEVEMEGEEGKAVGNTGEGEDESGVATELGTETKGVEGGGDEKMTTRREERGETESTEGENVIGKEGKKNEQTSDVKEAKGDKDGNGDEGMRRGGTQELENGGVTGADIKGMENNEDMEKGKRGESKTIGDLGDIGGFSEEIREDKGEIIEVEMKEGEGENKGDVSEEVKAESAEMAEMGKKFGDEREDGKEMTEGKDRGNETSEGKETERDMGLFTEPGSEREMAEIKEGCGDRNEGSAGAKATDDSKDGGNEIYESEEGKRKRDEVNEEEQKNVESKETRGGFDEVIEDKEKKEVNVVEINEGQKQTAEVSEPKERNGGNLVELNEGEKKMGDSNEGEKDENEVGVDTVGGVALRGSSDNGSSATEVEIYLGVHEPGNQRLDLGGAYESLLASIDDPSVRADIANIIPILAIKNKPLSAESIKNSLTTILFDIKTLLHAFTPTTIRLIDEPTPGVFKGAQQRYERMIGWLEGGGRERLDAYLTLRHLHFFSDPPPIGVETAVTDASGAIPTQLWGIVRRYASDAFRLIYPMSLLSNSAPAIEDKSTQSLCTARPIIPHLVSSLFLGLPPTTATSCNTPNPCPRLPTTTTTTTTPTTPVTSVTPITTSAKEITFRPVSPTHVSILAEERLYESVISDLESAISRFECHVVWLREGPYVTRELAPGGGDRIGLERQESGGPGFTPSPLVVPVGAIKALSFAMSHLETVFESCRENQVLMFLRCLVNMISFVEIELADYPTLPLSPPLAITSTNTPTTTALTPCSNENSVSHPENPSPITQTTDRERTIGSFEENLALIEWILTARHNASGRILSEYYTHIQSTMGPGGWDQFCRRLESFVGLMNSVAINVAYTNTAPNPEFVSFMHSLALSVWKLAVPWQLLAHVARGGSFSFRSDSIRSIRSITPRSLESATVSPNESKGVVLCTIADVGGNETVESGVETKEMVLVAHRELLGRIGFLRASEKLEPVEQLERNPVTTKPEKEIGTEECGEGLLGTDTLVREMSGISEKEEKDKMTGIKEDEGGREVMDSKEENGAVVEINTGNVVGNLEFKPKMEPRGETGDTLVPELSDPVSHAGSALEEKEKKETTGGGGEKRLQAPAEIDELSSNRDKNQVVENESMGGTETNCADIITHSPHRELQSGVVEGKDDQERQTPPTTTRNLEPPPTHAQPRPEIRTDAVWKPISDIILKEPPFEFEAPSTALLKKFPGPNAPTGTQLAPDKELEEGVLRYVRKFLADTIIDKEPLKRRLREIMEARKGGKKGGDVAKAAEKS